MATSKKHIPVSILKNKLLDFVRKVEKGESFQITRGSKPVAMLVPLPSTDTPVINFAKIEILGDVINLPEDNWSSDQDNL